MSPSAAAWLPWLAGLGGLMVGSFLNTLAMSLAGGPSILRARSACDSCGQRLAWWEMTPVAGYFLLRGRCRRCQAPLTPLYPLGEALSAALFVLCFATLGFTWAAAATLAFCLVLLVAALADLKGMIVPDLVVLPAAVLALMAAPWLPGPGGVGALTGAGFIGGGLWLIAWGHERITGRQGLGMGDVKLGLLLGAFLGPAAGGLAVGLGAMAGLAVYAGLMLLRRVGRRDHLPLAPWLALGGWAMALWGANLENLILGVQP